MDMRALMQQAQKMQEQVSAAQDQLLTETVEASAGGGSVTVVANGAGDIQKIAIAPEAIDPDDPELLEDLVLAAVKEAQRQAKQLAEQRMGAAVPGGLGALGL